MHTEERRQEKAGCEALCACSVKGDLLKKKYIFFPCINQISCCGCTMDWEGFLHCHLTKNEEAVNARIARVTDEHSVMTQSQVSDAWQMLSHLK